MANPIFYNDNQILTGLYTTGNELIDSNGIEYIGPYHRYPNNTFWSEFNPSPNTRQLYRDEKKSPYNLLSRLYKKSLIKKISNYIEPIEYYPVPTANDYENGYIERYFVKKTDILQLHIVEIDIDQYLTINSANNPGIDNLKWHSGMITWYLFKKTAEINNMNNIIKLSKTLPGIQYYLTNIYEFIK